MTDVDGQNDGADAVAEMPSDDIEVRDQLREAREVAEDETDACSATGEVIESYDGPRYQVPHAG